MKTKLILMSAMVALISATATFARTPVPQSNGTVVKEGRGYHRYNPYKGWNDSHVSIGVGLGFGGYYPGYYGGGYYGGGYGYGGYPYCGGYGYGYPGVRLGFGYPGYGYGSSYGGYSGGYYGGYGSSYGGYANGGSYNGGRSYGYNGNVVARVQQRLARAGFYRGSVDGVMGPRTRYAITAYERQHGLRVDGQIDRQLLATLGLA